MAVARRTLLSALVVATAVVVLVYAVLPSRAYFDQRDELASSRAELAELTAANDELSRRIEALDTREAIELLARRDFNFVYPGQETYAILPAPPPPVSLPATWPFWPVGRQLDDDAG